MSTIESIRYATARRFGHPEPVGWGDGVRDEPGPYPYQPQAPWQPSPLAQSDDCLRAAVTRPDTPAPQRPIVMWIPGGGFEQVSYTAAEASRLANQTGAVVVSIGYRVGVYGFAELSRYGGVLAQASNLGLRDCRAALQWVHRHAEQLGGDPNNITVLGESAGAFLGASLAVAPDAVGLARRYGLFSGGAARVADADQMTEAAEAVLTDLGVDFPEGIVQVDPARVLTAQRLVLPTDVGERNAPDSEALALVLDTDGDDPIIPVHPMQRYNQGVDATMLISSNRHEVALWAGLDPSFPPTNTAALVSEAIRLAGDVARGETLATAYLDDADGDLAQARIGLLSDYVYRLPAARLFQAHATAGKPARLLSLEDVPGHPAMHGINGQALFVGEFRWAADTAREELFRQQVGALIAGALDDQPPAELAVGEQLTAANAHRTCLARWRGIPRN